MSIYFSIYTFGISIFSEVNLVREFYTDVCNVSEKRKKEIPLFEKMYDLCVIFAEKWEV